jgi:protein O-GlcNAc transferase
MRRYHHNPRTSHKLPNHQGDAYFVKVAEERFRLAKRLHEQGENEKAEAIFKELIGTFRRLRLNASHLYASYGWLLLNLQRFEEAERVLHLSVEAEPGLLEAHVNLSAVYRLTKRDKLCEEEARKALAISKSEPKALLHLANAQATMKQHGLAAQTFLLLLRVDPGNVEGLKGLAGDYVALGEPSVSTPLYKRALELDPESWGIRTGLVFGMQYDPTVSNEEVLEEHFIYGDEVRKRCPTSQTDFRNSRSLDRKLKIGYFSADFGQHVVMQFVEKVITGHDRDRFEVHCLSNLPRDRADPATRRIQAGVDHFLELEGIYDDQALEAVRDQELDIVIDLMGHTSATRLTMMHRRMAPVQAVWCGYSGTTGVDNVDFLIGDHIIAPDGERAFFSEEPVRLPTSFLCYRPPDDAAAVAPPPFEKNGYITFGCMNNPSKINQFVVNWWAKILEQVPNSQLILRYHLYNDPLVYERLAKMLRLADVSDERFKIFGGGAAFTETYHLVDIALDPFPYNGTTTSCEALWMGVPVVTLYGDRFVARVGASLLTFSGLGGLVAANPTEYIKRAVELAGKPDELRRLRGEMRSHLVTTPVFNYDLFIPGLENAYVEMFSRWCNGTMPEKAYLAERTINQLQLT